jgi:hypothetical protein
MDRHINQCEPCQAFLASLKQAVAQCQSYSPQCDARRAEELRQKLVVKYQQAIAGLEKARSQSVH